MSALPKPSLPKPSLPGRDATLRQEEWAPMVNPLHPMHQELMRRVVQGGDAAVAEGVSRPARFAAIFYLGLASWGAIALVAGLIAHLV